MRLIRRIRGRRAGIEKFTEAAKWTYEQWVQDFPYPPPKTAKRRAYDAIEDQMSDIWELAEQMAAAAADMDRVRVLYTYDFLLSGVTLAGIEDTDFDTYYMDLVEEAQVEGVPASSVPAAHMLAWLYENLPSIGELSQQNHARELAAHGLGAEA